MIKAVEIKQFRGIKELRLDDLRMLNIIVGPSAAGKTALLEGVRLALGATPQVAFNLAPRGMPVAIPPNPTRDQFESIWSPLFFDFGVDTPIHFGLVDRENREARLEIFFDESKTMVATQPALPLSGNSPGTPPGPPALLSAIAPLAFKRKPFTGPQTVLHAAVTPDGQVQLEQGKELGVAVEFLSPAWQTNPQQIAAMFSKLSINGKTTGIISVLKDRFPEITDLSVESPAYYPILYASLRHVTKKMPLAMVSSGINKFVSLLLTIENTSGGLILLDEIENGIYYQTMPALWKALHTSAIQASTQLFLTTHSWECLQSAAPLVRRSPKDFSLIQMYQEDGQSVAKVVPGEYAAAAIDASIELRA